uniref:Preprotein-translocase subunit g n=1 Tax=Herposiphonia versicolor TaxID=2007163 RepID=A0A1Z1MGA4_9FLOR|nr:preprotein-translocase subunit g [Herposiphonia versicolor]ARW64791.1 preprotein-translocase subunit g [Herposiphonia versicolor]
MVIKIFWYIFGFSTIFFILINIPNSSGIGLSMNQNQLFNIKSNKLFMQQIIAFNVLIFLVLTVILLL